MRCYYEISAVWQESIYYKLRLSDVAEKRNACYRPVSRVRKCAKRNVHKGLYTLDVIGILKLAHSYSHIAKELHDSHNWDSENFSILVEKL